MGTLKTVMDSIRIRTRDAYKAQLTNEQLVVLINDVLVNVNDALRGLECVLVFDEYQKVDLTAGVSYATPSFEHRGIVLGSANIEGSPLALDAQPKFEIETGEPISYYMKGSVVHVYPTPDINYELTASFWKASDVMLAAEYDTANLPYDGIWDNAIMRASVVDAMEIRERDISRLAALADVAWEQALGESLEQGVIQRSMQGMYDYV